jgi:hypothetical protein
MKVTPRDSQRLSSQRPGGLGKEQRRQTELFHIGHLTLALLLGRDIQYLPAQAWESRVAGGSCQALGGRLGGNPLSGLVSRFLGTRCRVVLIVKIYSSCAVYQAEIMGTVKIWV